MVQTETNYNFLERPSGMLRGNVTAHVTELLRRAIVTLQLLPGTPIDKLAICERLGVSRSPVSEALTRLQSEGFVDILPQRGSIVSLIRVDEVNQHMLIRRALESELLSVLVGKYSANQLQALAKTLEDQTAAEKVGDAPLFHDLDRQFHELLYSGVGLERVREAIDKARANIDRARRMTNSPRRLKDILAEHDAIIKSIVAGDPLLAATVMRAHIDAATVEFFKYAKAHPHLFDGIARD
jgi:DNA-binding GntR family transcriptional regulator